MNSVKYGERIAYRESGSGEAVVLRADGATPRGIPAMSEDGRGLATKYRRLIENLESRNQVEVAIGVLMSLRGCGQTEAVSEFTNAVHETGLSRGEVASALVAVVSGNHTSPRHELARHRWRHLLALRGISAEPNIAKVDHSVRVRYGPANE